MAKKQTKGIKFVQKFNLRKNPKKLAVAIVAILLLVLFGALLLNGRKNAVAEITSTRDLAKSTVNTNNTKDTKTKTATAATPTPAAESTTANSPSGTSTRSSTPASSNTQTTATSPSATSPAPAPTPTPEPILFAIASGIYSSVDSSHPSIACNATVTLTFTASIVANAAGTATYHWVRSDGATGSDNQLVFSGAGAQEVSTTWTLSSDSTPGSYEVSGWEKVEVTAPNSSFSKASDAAFTLSVSC